MLVKLQSISDLGTKQLIYKEVFFKELIEEIADNHSVELAQRKVAFQYEVNNGKAFFLTLP